MGTPELPGMFLGCEHRPFKTELPDGTALSGMEYDCSHYLGDTVEMYCELSRKQTGLRPSLEHVPHPFLPEDHKESPSGMPCADFLGVQCPHCDTSFPVWEKGKPRRDVCHKHNLEGISEGKLPFGSPVFRSAKEVPR